MAIDTSLYLRDGSSNLTATEDSATGVDFRGIDAAPMNYFCSVPAISSGDTLVVKLQGSANNSTWSDVYTFPTFDGTSGAGVLNKELLINYRYRRYHATVSGNGGENFGAVKIWAAPAGRYTSY